ncbi:MAG: DUF6183 family protein [Actinomycetota bacterium]|nr:DUF6183 family protein [Actinomycetota bacterium]
MNDALRDLIEAADLNALLRAVDNLSAARAWDELIELADECEEALDRGKQLWPIANHIDYRLALEAPGDYAAEVLTTDTARFSHGPLTEVAASTHTWDELAPYIEGAQLAAYVAQERVMRGEVLEGDERAHREVLELPLELLPWEPTYALATYKPTLVEVAEPWEPKTEMAEVPLDPAELLDEAALSDSLLELVQPWTSESNGAARAVVVEGSAVGASSHLVLERLLLGPLQPDEAMQRLAWAAASGGAHGRRRGAAFGRFLAWYTAALLADLEWPVDPAVLGNAITNLKWYRFDEGEPEEGWILRLAAEDPEHGWSAAIAATDLRTE